MHQILRLSHFNRAVGSTFPTSHLGENCDGRNINAFNEIAAHVDIIRYSLKPGF